VDRWFVLLKLCLGLLSTRTVGSRRKYFAGNNYDALKLLEQLLYLSPSSGETQTVGEKKGIIKSFMSVFL